MLRSGARLSSAAHVQGALAGADALHPQLLTERPFRRGFQAQSADASLAVPRYEDVKALPHERRAPAARALPSVRHHASQPAAHELELELRRMVLLDVFRVWRLWSLGRAYLHRDPEIISPRGGIYLRTLRVFSYEKSKPRVTTSLKTAQ